MSPADLAQAVERSVRALLSETDQAGRPLLVSDVGAYLAQAFGSHRVYRRLGHKQLMDLLLTYQGLVVESMRGASVLRAARPEDKDALLRRVAAFVAILVDAGTDGLPTQMQTVKDRLASEFHGPEPVHVQLGYDSQEELVQSLPGMLVEERLGQLVVRPASRGSGSAPAKPK